MEKDRQATTQTPAILYHGTSRSRLGSIMADGCIRPAQIGVPFVSTSEDPAVALYFARLAAQGSDDPPSAPVVLSIDANAAASAGVLFFRFSDPVWGDADACEWEKEWASRSAVPVAAILRIDEDGAFRGPPSDQST